MKAFSLILILVLTFTSQKPIVRWINGLLGPCVYWKFNFAFRNFDFKCVHTNVSNLTKNRFDLQVQIACDQLQEEEAHLQNGFTLLGISQGGLIGRAILQRCETGKYIKRLITINSPHNGIALLPLFSPQNPANDFFAHVCYAGSSSTYFGPCSYFNSLKFKNEHFAAQNSIFDLNNQGRINQQYIDRVQGLELFVAISSTGDTIVQPNNSAVFGFYKDHEYSQLIDWEQTDNFKENRSGLKELEINGRFFRCSISGQHVMISGKNLQKLVVDFAEVGSNKFTENYGFMKSICKFKIVGSN